MCCTEFLYFLKCVGSYFPYSHQKCFQMLQVWVFCMGCHLCVVIAVHLRCLQCHHFEMLCFEKLSWLPSLLHYFQAFFLASKYKILNQVSFSNYILTLCSRHTCSAMQQILGIKALMLWTKMIKTIINLMQIKYCTCTFCTELCAWLSYT